MSKQQEIKRYSSYYKGWCLAFGEHKVLAEFGEELIVVRNEEQMGFVTSPALWKHLARELLGHHQEIPRIKVTVEKIAINNMEHQLSAAASEIAAGFHQFVSRYDTLHMFLTNHFCYPSGSRIITFSPTKPTVILYKEIAPLQLELG